MMSLFRMMKSTLLIHSIIEWEKYFRLSPLQEMEKLDIMEMVNRRACHSNAHGSLFMFNLFCDRFILIEWIRFRTNNNQVIICMCKWFDHLLLLFLISWSYMWVLFEIKWNIIWISFLSSCSNNVLMIPFWSIFLIQWLQTQLICKIDFIFVYKYRMRRYYIFISCNCWNAINLSNSITSIICNVNFILVLENTRWTS